MRDVPEEGLGLCLALLEAIMLPCNVLAPASLWTHSRLLLMRPVRCPFAVLADSFHHTK